MTAALEAVLLITGAFLVAAIAGSVIQLVYLWWRDKR
jgi:hypothetical protein